MLKSLATEEQLFEVVARPYFALLIDPDTQAWLKKLMAAAELVTITERIAACRDPTDDKFLELAVNGHADLIVSALTLPRGRHVPALITVFEPAGTAVALQRHTQLVRPDRHPEFP